MRPKRRSRCRAKSQRTGHLWIPLVVPLHHYRITVGFWRLYLASGLLVAAGFWLLAAGLLVAAGFWLLAAGRRLLLIDVADLPLRRYVVAAGFSLLAAGHRFQWRDLAILPLQG